MTEACQRFPGSREMRYLIEQVYIDGTKIENCHFGLLPLVFCLLRTYLRLGQKRRPSSIFDAFFKGRPEPWVQRRVYEK